MIEYRKIDKKDKEELINFITCVYNSLERKEFFIPFTQEGLEKLLYDKEKIVYGAYYKGKIIGTGMLYLSKNVTYNIAKQINIQNNNIAELGGFLVLKEYRNRGIMKNLEELLIKDAKKLNIEKIVITVHPENTPSNKAIEYTGAKIVKTVNLGSFLRNIYLLKL